MKIGIANDHRGYKLKNKLIKYLNKKGYQVMDYGCHSEIPVDYPNYAFELGNKVVNEEVEVGIAICGSGIGISIACNKVPGVRCAKACNVRESRLARLDNNANILALSAAMPYYKVLDIVDAFLTTNFSGVERHSNRINIISEYEKLPVSKKMKMMKVEKDDSDEC